MLRPVTRAGGRGAGRRARIVDGFIGPYFWDPGDRDRWLLGGNSSRERFDVGSREWLAADGPVAAADLLDNDPGDRPHVLALDETMASVRRSMTSRFC